MILISEDIALGLSPESDDPLAMLTSSDNTLASQEIISTDAVATDARDILVAIDFREKACASDPNTPCNKSQDPKSSLNSRA
jgi:hypothetical protein